MTSFALDRLKSQALEAREAMSAASAPIRTRTRAKLTRLVQQLPEIEQLSSTESQVDAYGLEAWQRNFELLRTIETLPGIELRGQELQWYLWQTLPDGPFRRFQQVFCHPDDLVVPRSYVPTGKSISWMMPESVAGCLVRPDGISDAFAENLQLVDFDDQDDELGRLRKKQAATARLKMLWDASTAFASFNQRMRVVMPPVASVQDRYPGVFPLASEVMGSIMYLREDPRSPGRSQRITRGTYGKIGPPLRMEAHIFTSAYDALGREAHIRDRYDQEELPALASIDQMILDVNASLGNQWKPKASAETKRECKERADSVSSQVRKQLSNVVHPDKTKVAKTLAEMESSLDRRNVGAAMSKTVAARNAIQRRCSAVDAIESCTEKDRQMVETCIRRLEQWCKSMRASIQKGADRLKEGHLDSSVLSFFQPDLTGVRSPLLRPFQSYVSSYDAIHQSMRSALEQNDIARANNLALRMHVVGKLQALHTCIARTKLLTIGGGPSVATAQEYMQKIVAILEAREVNATDVDPFVQEIFAPIEANARVLLSIVQRIAAGSMDVREEALEEMKQCIEQMSLPEAAQAIAGINGHGSRPTENR